jgi:AcrR family transcriptional regulator
MKQRKKQPVRTRQAILTAAGVEFTRHGYAGAGLGAIVARAELTKGALFHHFPDKRTLALAWVADVLTPQHAALWLEPLGGIRSLEGLKQFCRARCMAMQADDILAALVALTAESAAADEVLGAAMHRVFARWREELAGMLERGKAEGWIHRSIQPAAEAAFIVAAFAGFAVTTGDDSGEGARRTSAAALEGYVETLRTQ